MTRWGVPRPAVLALALLLAAAAIEPATAMTMSGGGEVGWTRLAEDVLFSADLLGTIVPIIGLVLLGAMIVFGISLPPVFQIIVAGALLLLGPAVFDQLMGMELLP